MGHVVAVAVHDEMNDDDDGDDEELPYSHLSSVLK